MVLSVNSDVNYCQISQVVDKYHSHYGRTSKTCTVRRLPKPLGHGMPIVGMVYLELVDKDPPTHSRKYYSHSPG